MALQERLAPKRASTSLTPPSSRTREASNNSKTSFPLATSAVSAKEAGRVSVAEESKMNSTATPPNSSRRDAKRPRLKTSHAASVVCESPSHPSKALDVVDPVLRKWLGISAKDGRLVVNKARLQEEHHLANALWVHVRCYDSSGTYKFAFDSSQFDGEIFVFCDFADISGSPFDVLSREFGCDDDAFICTNCENGTSKFWCYRAVQGEA